MKILVVDDSKTMRMIIVKILGEIGLKEIDEADSAEAAHYIVVRKPVDLILLDWNMPKVSGLDFLKTLRAMKTQAYIPVMMVTTEGEREKIIQASSFGIDGFVVKPFTKETLAQKVLEVCRKRGLPLPDVLKLVAETPVRAAENPVAEAAGQAPAAAGDQAPPTT
jgi:two-component system, chemotaxis family, chemotaxis protein CheY